MVDPGVVASASTPKYCGMHGIGGLRECKPAAPCRAGAGQLTGVSAPRQAYFNHSGHNRARNPQSREDLAPKDAAGGG